MSKVSVDTFPELIFDSRKASLIYKDYGYYRSSDFTVPAGYVAVVELTTHRDNMGCLKFQAMRTALQNECYEKEGIVKKYRRWRCRQGMGRPQDDTSGGVTDFNEYGMSIVIWGHDEANKNYVDFEYITRPGNYYLFMCSSNTDDVINDCDRPTLIEVTMIPIGTIPDLNIQNCAK